MLTQFDGQSADVDWMNAVQEDFAAAAIEADPQRCVCQGKLCPQAGHLPLLQPV